MPTRNYCSATLTPIQQAREAYQRVSELLHRKAAAVGTTVPQCPDDDGTAAPQRLCNLHADLYEAITIWELGYDDEKSRRALSNAAHAAQEYLAE